MPEEIVGMEINSIKSDNGNVTITANELTKQNGKYLIKILTQNEEPEVYTLTIDANMTTAENTSADKKEIKLYAYNEKCNDYYKTIQDTYDVNTNSKTEEQVGEATTNIEIILPTKLVTYETVTNYNKNEETTYAPNVAEVEKINENNTQTEEQKNKGTAQINIGIINNYQNTINGVQILGKIPFEGNTYVINGENLNSKFTAQLTEQGIELPEELQEGATIYYSENEIPDRNLENAGNGWTLKEDVQDFSKIKTYLIVLNKYLEPGEEYILSYKVNIPQEISYNKTSYSTHAVYYEVETEEGKIQLQTEPNKVGIRPVKKFNLDLTTYKINSDLLIKNTTYLLKYSEEDADGSIQEKTKILATNKDGKIISEDLYIEKEYILQQRTVESEYEINTQIVKFKIHEDELISITGVVRRQGYVDGTLKIELENEKVKKYNLVIRKVDENGEILNGAEFKLTSKDTGISSTYKASGNGEIFISNLNECVEGKNITGEYTLQEIKAPEKYQLDETELKFKAIRDENEVIQIEIIDGENIIKTNNETGEKEITSDETTLTINIVNKIREYTITKLDEDSKYPIQGAEFAIYSSEDSNYENVTYMYTKTTDENGKINLQLPYGYYKAIEVKAATGYVLDESEEARTRYFKVERDGNNLPYVKENVKEINYIEDLVDLSNSVNRGSSYGNAILLRDIDFNDDSSYKNPIDTRYGDYNGDGKIEGIKAELTSGTGFKPIGSAGWSYSKSFDGNGHEIRNIYVDGNSYYLGLFGHITGAVANLGVTGNITGKHYVGGIAGYVSNNGIITNCYNTCDINNYASEAQMGTGGIVGCAAYNSSIINCHNMGNISNYDSADFLYTGGIAGRVDDSNVTNCYNIGDISSNAADKDIDIGGIAGNVNCSNITNCYNIGNVSNSRKFGSLGGIVGNLYNSNITNCYNAGKMCNYASIQFMYTGGIAGEIHSSNITNCYNTGELSNIYYTGGIVGYVIGSNITNCYYLNKTSSNGIDYNDNLTVIKTVDSKTYEEMKSQQFCEQLNTNRKEINSDIELAIWNYNKNSYPTLNTIETNDLTITNEMTKNYTITKVDKETQEPLQNVKFAIYDIENNDFAKDLAGRYVGKQNENRIYVVTTDENGQIKLGLPEGNYKAVEVETINDYQIKQDPIYFKIMDKTVSTEAEADIEINYIEDLVDLSNEILTSNETYSGKTVKLMRTLDFNVDSSYRNPNDQSYGDYNLDSKTEGIKSELTSGAGFKPIGKQSTDATYGFAGTFDGNGYEIKNLYTNTTNYSYVGLFSGINNATIINLGITGDSVISGGTVASGGIAGFAYNNSIISNCYNTQQVKSGYAGGIIGKTGSSTVKIVNCYNSGEINGTTVGGILGDGTGEITNSYNTGTVIGTGRSGGIVGNTWYFSINNCYNTGHIKGNSYVGGIIGEAETPNVKISNCYNTGNIEGPDAGGIVGFADWMSKIYNCYNLGDINGSNSAGGIAVASNHGGVSIANCYNNGRVYAGEYAGGIVCGLKGYGYGNLYNCYNTGIISATIKAEIMSIYPSYNDIDYLHNCYYIKKSGAQGVNGKDDVAGKVEAITEEYMKSKDFCNLLNENRSDIDTSNTFKDAIFENWIYEENIYPTFRLYNLSAEVTVENEKINECTITKIDQDTNEPLQGVKFAIYDVEINDFVRNQAGNYIGTRNEDDIYVIATDVNGQIKLNLPDGYYKAVEIETIDGYKLKEEPTYFTVGENTSETNPEADFAEGNEIIITNEKLKEFTITKIDEQTKAPIPNTKFAIYSTDEEFNTLDFAKDSNGKYIGTLNENNIYTFTTNESGKITVQLPDGYYKAVEIKSADGYLFEESESVRTTYFKVGKKEVEADIEINYIEDLVELSNFVNSGNTYSGKTIKLSRNLDFNDDTSYRNPDDTSYGDYNEDGKTEGIKAELTTGMGFKPIGINSYSFQGIFNGNGYEIKNIYINGKGSYSIGLFGYVVNATIKNIGITGNISSSYAFANVGGIVGYAEISNISNCYNLAKVESKLYTGGIAGYVYNRTTITNCYNKGTIVSDNVNTGGAGGIIGYSNSQCVIKNCYNIGYIKAVYAGGIVGDSGTSIINFCYNNATVEGITYVGGITARNWYGGSISNCFNTGDVKCLSSNNNYIYVGGIVGYLCYSSTMNNCYNVGNVSCLNTNDSVYVGGLVAASNSGAKANNCYNIGTVQGKEKGEIAGRGSTGLTNCYYLDNLGTQGFYGTDDLEGSVEAKTEEFMKSKRFKNLLNTNKETITSNVELENWVYEDDQYPKFKWKEYITDSQVTIENKKIDDYTITKIDQETGAPIQGAQFTIYYSKDSNYTNLTPAKDIDGKYVGTQNSDGEYILTTDENGQIKLSLPAGYYKAVEVKAADGYMLADDEGSRTSYFIRESTEPKEADIEINYIEDLVDISNAIYSSSERYAGKTIKLMRTLDFKNDSSYKDPNSTVYGDYNGDGKTEGIKAELTNESGRGFRPIGTNPGAYFAGTFDGNGYEIRNININYSDYGVGLFGDIEYGGTVKNLGISGNITGTNYVGGIVGASGYYSDSKTTITNCYNMATIKSNGSYSGGIEGLANYNSIISDCYNIGNVIGNQYAGGIVGYFAGEKILNCYNTANIDVNKYSAGGIVGVLFGNTEVLNCYNTGKISATDSAGGIVGIYPNSSSNTVINCYNIGNINGNNVGGILGNGGNNDSIVNCYYLNTTASQGRTGYDDSIGVLESKTLEEMQSVEFCELLKNNSYEIESNEQLASWIYNENSYPTLAIVQVTDLTIPNISKGKDYTITKVDKETKQPIPNVKFAIYNMEDNDFAKDKLDRYIGTKNKDGIYVFITDENGKITVNLPDGYYKAVEVESADGYILEESEASRTTYFRVGEEGENADFTIYYIEDLVDLSNELLDSNVTYNGKRVELLRTIDFKNDSSYRNPNDTSYGDYNGDGIIEGIKAELTKDSGQGFKPLGGMSTSYNQGFSGTFDGNGYEIRNVYINRSQYGNGLFSCLSYATISNLGVSGSISYSASGLGGIAGCAEYSTISNCYNMAKVSSGSVGGIVAYAYNCTIINCYNTGAVIGSYNAGGIVGSINNSQIINCYNTGDVISSNSSVGGITSSTSNSSIINCYNTGNVTTGNAPAGGITGSVLNSKITNCYNTGKITSASSIEGGVIGQSPTNSTITNCYYQNGSASKGIYGQNDVAGIVEVRAESEMKSAEFTDLLNNNKNNITSDIVLLDWVNQNSSYPTLSLITIVKSSEVTIENEKMNVLVITKVDKDTGEKLPNAEFTIETISDAGSKLGNELKVQKSISNDVIGEIQSNSTYKFVQNGATYESNNTNISSSTAESYFPIDLTNFNGTVTLNVNASISSQSGYDIGYATITTNTATQYYSNSTGRFIYISGTVDNGNYTTNLEGGKLYYLHVGYYKNSSTNTGSDKFTINSISLSGTEYVWNIQSNSTYKFERNGTTYVSNNAGVNSSVANSYIPIDLTSQSGKYKLSVIASISSEENYDYGYATVTTDTTVPTFDSEEGRFIFISGVSNNRVYTTELEGGKAYYLHLGYKKDASNSKEEDKFTINNITVSSIENEYNSYKQVVTDSEGQAKISMPAGTQVRITETKAPDGYILDESSQIVEMSDQNIELTITNQQLTQITVHHYKQGTGPEFGTDPVILADDEITVGNDGEEYTTTPKDDIEHYKLSKDENGEDLIPENATGTYKPGNQDIYYYYTREPLEVIVHHYLENTEDKLAEDENYTYNEGEHYKVTPSEDLLEKYELVKVVGDEEKDITENEEITYYYKIKEYEITTRVEIPDGRLEKGGTISGEGEEPYETVEHGEPSKQEIVIVPDSGYKVKQIKLVSIDDEENKTETIIYGKDAVDTAEIAYRPYLNGSISLTQFTNMTEDKEIIVQFEPNEGKLIVHHYIENSTEKIHGDQITVDVLDKVIETSEIEKEGYALVEAPEEKSVTITEETQEKTYYYQKQYKITTDVIEHNEAYKDGTVKKNVKGGTITDEDKNSHEYVLKNRNSQEIIEITPDEGYEIVKVTINGEELDYKNMLDENGKLTLPEGFFQNMQEDKHIKVEFRKKTVVYVKYLEEETEKVLFKDGEKDYLEIEGYEGQEFETVKKAIPYHKDSTLGITDENKEPTNPDGTMFADEITIIYWYAKIPSGIVERHIEINEKGETKELESKVTDGFVSEKVTTNRKDYKGYIPVDGPKNSNENVTVVAKDETSKTVTFQEDEVIEVWYYYEKQFEITTEVKPHEEKVLNPETNEYETKQVEGGTISKEYITDEEDNQIEVTYEEVLNRGNSTKEIVMKPEEGYRIKSITINEEPKSLDNFEIAEDGSITLPEGYFEDVQENKHVVVEFERIPAKVIVQYKDIYTKESILEDKVVEGYVNDKYNEQRPEVESYIPSDPEPENSEGTMTEDTITVTYWYTKQFKITTEVKEHEEEDTEGNTVSVKGGEISGEEEAPYEIVTRGENSTKEIIIKPEDGYKIKELIINEKEMEIKDLQKENGSIELPFFENMQEDKHIVVEFEKIPATVKVQYLEDETEIPVSEEEIQNGYVNDKYKTDPKQIEYYDLVEEKYPENSEGKMTEEELIVKYYYKKMPFNMKVEKELEKVQVNGSEESVELINNKLAKLEINYKDINSTNIEIAYKIKVTNTEKIAGTALIEERIPEGFEFIMELSSEGWTLKDGSYIVQTEEINPGETKEYKVTLRWKPEEENKGQKQNTAKITQTTNTPNYEETTLEDNEDSAIVEIKLNKTIQDIINNAMDDIKDGNINDAITGVVSDVKDVVTNVKTGDAIIISVVTLIVAGVVVVIIIIKK